MKTFVANHLGSGTWGFTCPLHEPVEEWIETTSQNRVLQAVKDHIDEEHPGVKVRIMIHDSYDIHTTYTGTQTIETGDLL